MQENLRNAAERCSLSQQIPAMVVAGAGGRTLAMRTRLLAVLAAEAVYAGVVNDGDARCAIRRAGEVFTHCQQPARLVSLMRRHGTLFGEKP